MIRLGFVGCGSLLTSKFTVAAQYKDLCECVATCDIIKERAENAANIIGANFFTTDYKELIGYVDAVYIALPHNLHYEVGRFFVDNNVHVLMEKPLCNTEEECLALVDAAEKKGVTLMCEYPVRFLQGIRKMKDLLDTGEYGEIFQMSIWTEQFTDQIYENHHKSNVKWVGDIKTSGGGQLFSHGCHYIDLLLWFLGKPVSGVHMSTQKGTPWLDEGFEGTSNVVIKFEDGVMGYHFGTWGARGTKQSYSWQIHTDKGLFEYKYEKLYFMRNLDPYNTEEKEILWDFEDRVSIEEEPIKHFLICVTEHKKPLTDGKSAIQSLRVIWRLYEAEKNNEIADLRGLGLDE